MRPRGLRRRSSPVPRGGRDRLGEHDVARPRDQPAAEGRPRGGPGVEGHDRDPATTSPGPSAEVVRTRTGRPARPAAGRREPAPTAPSQPGRSPSSSTTRVPSWIVTPRSRATRRSPRARIAGWTVAAPGMNAPARRTGEATRARTSSAAIATYRSPTPSRSQAVTAAVHFPSCAGAALDRERPRLRVPGVHAVLDAPPAQRVDRAVHRPGPERSRPPRTARSASAARPTNRSRSHRCAPTGRRHRCPPRGGPPAPRVRVRSAAGPSTARCSRRPGSRRRP